MSYEDIPAIPPQNLYRAVYVSATRGDRVLKALSEQGAILPVKTPTGRFLLTPADGRILYARLVQGA